MDKAVSAIAAILLGAVMLLAAWFLSSDSPDLGQRSLTAGLTAMGGPAGLWGGVALVLAAVGAAYGLHEIMNVWVGRSIIAYLKERGRTDDRIIAQLGTMPISRGLKQRLRKWVAEGKDR
jgi:hypothetical protein